MRPGSFRMHVLLSGSSVAVHAVIETPCTTPAYQLSHWPLLWRLCLCRTLKRIAQCCGTFRSALRLPMPHSLCSGFLWYLVVVSLLKPGCFGMGRWR